VKSNALLQAGQTAAAQPTLRLWIPLVAAAGTAAVIAVAAARIAYRDWAKKSREPRLANWLRLGVDAGPAWTLSDSWVTNIAGTGSIVGAIAAAFGSLQAALSAADSVGIVILFLVFGGAAALSPVVYAATAKQESEEVAQMTGTTWGFLLAGAVTLLAVMGELATIGLVGWDVTGSGPTRTMLVVFLALAALVTAVYSVRSLVLFATPAPAPAVSADAEKATAHRHRSYLGTANVSATL
jgi:hypothetical protein